MKYFVLASVSALAIASAPANAQSNSNAPQIDATSPAGEEQGLQEIVVTAQRVEQSVQKAPLAITVVDPAELTRQSVVRSEDLSRVVPALVAVNSGGPNTVFFLRGVGNFTVNAYSDPAIAFSYDGVYIGRPTSTQGFFYDLQRVEVLKGPQGTLYGRNATGGAINVIPKRPRIGEAGGELQASYGNYDTVQAQGALNLPIGEHGAFRISGAYNRHDGYLSDGTSDQRDYAVRAQVLAELTPNLTMRIGADFEHQGGVGAGSFQYGTTAFNGTGYTFTPAPGLNADIGIHDPRTEAFLQTRFIPQAGRNSEALGSYPYQDNAGWGFNGEANWTTSAGTLTLQAAYRESVIHSLYTVPDFRGARNDERDNQVSVEARFAGKIGNVADYLVGAFYFDENIKGSQSINQLTSTPFQNFTTGTGSKAVFGKLALHATDTITLTAAGRYTSDKKNFNGLSDVYVLFCGAPTPPQDFCPTVPLQPLVNNAAELVAFYAARGITIRPPGSAGPNAATLLNAKIPINASLGNDKFTYRLAVDWQVTPTSMLYASYETGFRGGGFSFARGLESYQPETISAVTLGSKNRFFGNRLQLNIEAFYWKYKNQQFSQFGFDLGTPPASVFYTANVGASTNKGIDVDVDFLLTPTTRLSGSVQYLDAKYDSFISYSPNQGVPPNAACPFTTTIYNGAASYAIDCSGRPSFNSPKWSFNAGIQQTVRLTDYKFVLQAGTRYRGDVFVAPSYQPWLVSKAGFQSDASITFAPDSDRWFVSGYINNIEDSRRIQTVNTNAGLGTLTATTTAPRTFGIRLGGRF